jgi:hypothetical protein
MTVIRAADVLVNELGPPVLRQQLRHPTKQFSKLAIWPYGMKTTLNIDDTVMAELEREAARQGRTMSTRRSVCLKS